MDITELILTQHHEQRRTFALLDELADDPVGLAAVWERLTILLEVHAKAEELFFDPRLLEVGTGGGDAERTAASSGARRPAARTGPPAHDSEPRASHAARGKSQQQETAFPRLRGRREHPGG